MALVWVLVFLGLASLSAAQQASIVANGNDVELQVTVDADVYVKRGTNDREAIVTMTAFHEMQSSLSTTIQNLQSTIDALNVSIQSQLLSQSDSIANVSSVVNQISTATASRFEADESNVQNLSTSVIDLTSSVASVNGLLGGTAADWIDDYGVLFDYYYNTDQIINPAGYVPLLLSADGTGYTCNGLNIPVPASACGNGPIYLKAGLASSHPGRGAGQSGLAFDSYVISSYNVTEDGLYSITNSSLISGNPTASNGYEVVVVVEMTATNTTVKTMNREVFPQLNSWRLLPTTQFEFNHLLGFVPTGSRIHVAIGPNGQDGNDVFRLDYTISRGVLPALIAPPGQGVPLNHGFNPTTTEQHWKNTSPVNTWNTLVTANPANPVLEDGAYVVFLDHFNTFQNGGSSYGEQCVSSPFVWDNALTNSGEAFAIPSHMAGHANNGEIISFQTLRQPAVAGGALQLQFMSNRAWTSPVQLRFRFLRLF